MVLSPLRSFIITVLTATIIKLCCFDTGAGSATAQRKDVGSRSGAATKRQVYHDGTQPDLFRSVLYLWMSQDPTLDIAKNCNNSKTKNNPTCILHGSVGEESANSGAAELVARRQRLR